MNGISDWLKKIAIVLCLFFPATVMAFNFGASSVTAYMDAATFPTTVGDITSLASGSASISNTTGYPNPTSRDRVVIESVVLDPELSNRGFTLEVKIANSGWLSIASAINDCVWVDTRCSYNKYTSFTTQPTQPVSVRLKRNSTVPYDPIPYGTNIATIKLQQSNIFGVIGAYAYLYFKFDGAVTPVVPTCDVKSFDNIVTLPSVKRADLISQGSGRYNGVTKEFTINLDCENTPKVSVKFDGDKMSGIATEDVLVNKLSGNENVGIQLMYNNNPLKIGEGVEVLSAAGATEALKFNAYYYVKNSTIQSGPVKAQSEFTFTYQ